MASGGSDPNLVSLRTPLPSWPKAVKAVLVAWEAWSPDSPASGEDGGFTALCEAIQMLDKVYVRHLRAVEQATERTAQLRRRRIGL